MEPRKRTHLVNELMEEAGLMLKVLTKAMEGQEEEAHLKEEGLHMPEDEPHAPPTCTLEEEHAAWQKVCAALHDIQTQLDRIEQAERARLERATPSA